MKSCARILYREEYFYAFLIVLIRCPIKCSVMKDWHVELSHFQVTRSSLIMLDSLFFFRSFKKSNYNHSHSFPSFCFSHGSHSLLQAYSLYYSAPTLTSNFMPKYAIFLFNQHDMSVQQKRWKKN